MNCLKRAYLYVTRKKGKSILLFLILLVTATFVLSGLCIGDATRQAQMNLRKNLGGAFDMTINYSEDNPYYRQEESENDDGTKDVLMYSMKQVSPEMVANIRNIAGVKYCDASTENLYDGLLPIPGTVPVEEKFSHCVTGIGVWRSSEQNFFTSEKLTLIAGRHIAENDTHSAIISDVLAEKNQIKLGNTFTITGGSRKKISLEVIGLFHANVTEKLGDAVTSYDKIQNHIFTDVASAIEAENSVVVQGFDDVKVTVDDPENLKQIMEQVKHLPGYEENVYTIAADDEAYQSAAAPLSSLDGLVKCLLIGIIAVSIIILALILTLWGKTRVHETGVFLSLGIKKGEYSWTIYRRSSSDCSIRFCGIRHYQQYVCCHCCRYALTADRPK